MSEATEPEWRHRILQIMPAVPGVLVESWKKNDDGTETAFHMPVVALALVEEFDTNAVDPDSYDHGMGWDRGPGSRDTEVEPVVFWEGIMVNVSYVSRMRPDLRIEVFHEAVSYEP